MANFFLSSILSVRWKFNYIHLGLNTIKILFYLMPACLDFLNTIILFWHGLMQCIDQAIVLSFFFQGWSILICVNQSSRWIEFIKHTGFVFDDDCIDYQFMILIKYYIKVPFI